jgi:hypothetical protein
LSELAVLVLFWRVLLPAFKETLLLPQAQEPMGHRHNIPDTENKSTKYVGRTPMHSPASCNRFGPFRLIVFSQKMLLG